MHKTILQRVKQFLNVEMINLEKTKEEKCQAPQNPFKNYSTFSDSFVP